MENDENDDEVTAERLYDSFLKTVELLPTIQAFCKLCEALDINPKNYKTVFSLIKSKLKSWKCQTLFNKLEKKGKHADYKNKPCAKLKVLVIGAGPVGLRTAVEAALLGAQVVVIEKRESFSRNNVLHLWPFLIVDLKALGVKSFFGKFCAGSLDHISIRRLQCILLKICLLLGVQIHPKTLFMGINEPGDGKGWRGTFKPLSSPLNSLDFDAIVGCDGKYNSLKFERKEFRGKLAIAITCNFINKQTSEEARVEEISGVAFIYNQEFFQQLTERTGVELENIVYYKDETHYFVMTAKKKSLLSKGVIKQDSKDVFKLLSGDNINHRNLLQYAEQAADFATKYQLPHHEFAVNPYGKEDVAMFDFTSIHQAQSASKMLERRGKRLLLCIAGDVLLEPFWPTGSGCARGFLSAMDAAWMIRGLGLGRESLDLLQERESIFTILPQSKPDSLIRFHDRYSIDPSTRYLNLNARILSKDQIRYLLDCSDKPVDLENWCAKSDIKASSKPVKVKKNEVDPDTLLKWCKEQVAEYPNIEVINMSSSWRSGLAFCAIINRYRPHLIDYFSLDPNDMEGNCEKAFSVAEEHLGIPPKISSHDLATQKITNKLAIMAYVSLYYEALNHETPALILNDSINQLDEESLAIISPRANVPNICDSPRLVVSKLQLLSISPRNKVSARYYNHNYKERKAPFISPRVIVPPIPPTPRSPRPRGFGLRVALVTKGTQVPQSKDGETVNVVPPKSPTSKMSILSKLSRRSKKTKSRLTKKTKKDKESKIMTKDNGVVLKSFGKKDANGNPGQNGISSSDESPVKSTAPLLRNNRKLANGSDTEKKNDLTDIELRNPTTGKDKFKRISQLAESVFGDTIVQKPNQVNQVQQNKTRVVEDLTESEKCHFCSRKVYVMERQSAEGLFFHRKCFRCCVCKCQLLIGNYAFYGDDDDDGEMKFYCKMHYNRLIYQPKQTSQQQQQQQQVKKTSDKKRRPVTQIIQRKDVHEAFQAKSTDIVQISPKFSRQVRDIQSDLQKNLPELNIRAKKKVRTSSNPQPREEVDGQQVEKEGKGPYDRFAARELLDRHPSVLKCSPEKVTTKSFFTSSKHSVSTPNLTKLIQEDSMFEKERKIHIEKINEPVKKRLQLSDELAQKPNKTVRKKLSVPEDLKSKTSFENDQRDIYGSEQYRDRNESFNLAREDSYGAVHRRPMDERRAQYPVSMAFTEGMAAAGLRPVSVAIDIDEAQTEDKPKKKKKLVLKKKKAKKIYKEDTIEEGDENEQLPSPNKMKPIKDKQKSFEKSIEKSYEKSPKVGRKGKEKKTKLLDAKPQQKRDDEWILIKRNDVADEYDINTSSSEDEGDGEDDKHVGVFRRTFGIKQKKKPMTVEEIKLFELKKKKRENRKIQKELKERELKRLWEAQSIQRKLNEVDVKQFDLEERARQVEKDLQDDTMSPERTNVLMFDWFHLVNEKNTLLRFESELVIQSNSIQLEDRQARLEQQIRALLTAERPKIDSHNEIDRLTKELVDTVEQRNALVELLEEDRIREMEEDRNLKEVFAKKAHDLGMDRLI